MTEKILTELKTLAGKNATVDQLRYWCKLLGINPSVRGRVAYVTPKEKDALQEFASLVLDGNSPKEAARKIAHVPTVSCQVPTVSSDPLNGELKEIRSVLLVMAEEMKGLRQENIVLHRELSSIRGLLLPSNRSGKEVVSWKPETPSNPLEGKSWFEKIYIKTFCPEKLRRFDS